jgi:two-component system, LytTR family, response regulator
MNTLIVDDVKLSRDGLGALINTYFPEAVIIGSVPSIEEARKVLKSETVDLLFLDIQLQDGIGFDILDDVSFDTKIIFITAYEKYAIDAIRKGAFDYLLKPVNVVELKNCIQRIREIKSLEIQHQEKEHLPDEALIYRSKIGISSMDSIDYLDISDIRYLKADGKYTVVCLKDQTITSSKNLKMFEFVLPEAEFMRVHHSYLVNISEIKRFKKDDTMLILKDGTEIPVSKSRKEMLMRRLVHI